MAFISAWQVGSLSSSTVLCAQKMTTPFLTIAAPKGPPCSRWMPAVADAHADTIKASAMAVSVSTLGRWAASAATTCALRTPIRFCSGLMSCTQDPVRALMFLRALGIPSGCSLQTPHIIGIARLAIAMGEPTLEWLQLLDDLEWSVRLKTKQLEPK